MSYPKNYWKIFTQYLIPSRPLCASMGQLIEMQVLGILNNIVEVRLIKSLMERVRKFYLKVWWIGNWEISDLEKLKLRWVCNWVNCFSIFKDKTTTRSFPAMSPHILSCWKSFGDICNVSKKPKMKLRQNNNSLFIGMWKVVIHWFTV